MEIDDMMMLTSNSKNEKKKDLSAEQKAALHALLQSYENEVLAMDAYCKEFECDFCPLKCEKKCPVTMAKILSKYLQRVDRRIRNGD